MPKSNLRPSSMPDMSDDLLTQALSMSQSGNFQGAMSTLTNLIQDAPENPLAHQLLGALLAQAGLIDDAITALTQAVKLQPGLYYARFQLGAVLLTSNRVNEARDVWLALDSLGGNHILNQFKNGMMHAVNGQMVDAANCLDKALTSIEQMPFLRHDIEIALASVREVLNESTDKQSVNDELKSHDSSPNLQKTDETEEATHHVLVNIYHQSKTIH